MKCSMESGRPVIKPLDVVQPENGVKGDYMMDIVEFAQKMSSTKLTEPQKKVLISYETGRRRGKHLTAICGRFSGRTQMLKMIDVWEKAKNA